MWRRSNANAWMLEWPNALLSFVATPTSTSEKVDPRLNELGFNLLAVNLPGRGAQFGYIRNNTQSLCAFCILMFIVIIY